MIGRQVKHKAFGIGSIIGYEGGKITVDFSGTIRIFQFPDSFERFLSTEDSVLHGIVADAILEKDDARKKAEEEWRKSRESEIIRATQTASSIPCSAPSTTHSPGRQDRDANRSV